MTDMRTYIITITVDHDGSHSPSKEAQAVESAAEDMRTMVRDYISYRADKSYRVDMTIKLQ